MVEVTWLPKPEATLWLVATSVIAAVAIVAAIAQLPRLSIGAAAAAGLLAAARLEVFEHALLAGLLPAPWQRICIVAALAIALGIVAASLVSMLGPTPAHLGVADDHEAVNRPDER